ncbi:GNAT family N-acetyltransferase [Nocardioides sp.]|uniref:GNAT family N-acetyltransferase n=1 Tax=Nocardioides sp. TaxID=35761 RepID=UPI003515434E
MATTTQNRFESDPDTLVEQVPDGWEVAAPDATDQAELVRLTALLRDHERHGRGWPGADVTSVLVEVAEPGLATRENIVVRDPAGVTRAWGSVHDRAGGRMLFVHVVDRTLTPPQALRCSRLLVEWARAQACAVGAARGLAVQQIDTGSFADDPFQHGLLTDAGFTRVRRWWQMSRPVVGEDAAIVSDPAGWTRGGVRFRPLTAGPDDEPMPADVRAVHAVVEGSFRDHFNHLPETCEEFVHRLRTTPGHRFDHWWLAELVDDSGTAAPRPVGALVATEIAAAPAVPGDPDAKPDPGGSYVEYLGVLGEARGRGVATGLLDTVVADAARRGRDRVGLEVDADSPTGADRLYLARGWRTSYTTESWHLDVPVG